MEPSRRRPHGRALLHELGDAAGGRGSALREDTAAMRAGYGRGISKCPSAAGTAGFVTLSAGLRAMCRPRRGPAPKRTAIYPANESCRRTGKSVRRFFCACQRSGSRFSTAYFCLLLFTSVYSYFLLFIPIHSSFLLFVSIYSSFLLFISIYSCFLLFSHISSCFLLFISVSPVFSYLFLFIYIFSCLFLFSPVSDSVCQVWRRRITLILFTILLCESAQHTQKTAN